MRVEIVRRLSASGNVSSEEIMRLAFGLRDIEVRTYKIISVSGAPVDVGTVARRIGRDRTTAQRALCNLVTAGIIERRVKPHDRLFYTYEAVEEERIRRAVREYLRDLFRQLSRSLEEDEF